MIHCAAYSQFLGKKKSSQIKNPEGNMPLVSGIMGVCVFFFFASLYFEIFGTCYSETLP